MTKSKASNEYFRILKKNYPSTQMIKEDKYSVTFTIHRGRAHSYNVLLKASKLLVNSFLKYDKLPIILVIG
jgi:hypothetical protein